MCCRDCITPVRWKEVTWTLENFRRQPNSQTRMVAEEPISRIETLVIVRPLKVRDTSCSFSPNYFTFHVNSNPRSCLGLHFVLTPTFRGLFHCVHVVCFHHMPHIRHSFDSQHPRQCLGEIRGIVKLYKLFHHSFFPLSHPFPNHQHFSETTQTKLSCLWERSFWSSLWIVENVGKKVGAHRLVGKVHKKTQSDV